MASFLIHMAVAHEVNKYLNRDYDKILFGSVAPDISKLIGESKEKTHFQTTNNDIPNMERFLSLYGKYLKDDFVMGYYIHLYTDYLWYSEFLKEKYNDEYIRLFNGNVIPYDDDLFLNYTYTDYTSINNKLVDTYKINLDFLYHNIPKIENIIKEMNIKKLDVLQKRIIEIYESTVVNDTLVFSFDEVKDFIKYVCDKIINNLKRV